MEKRELVALLNLSSWCLMVVERLFLAVPQGCLRFVIVVFPDHTHLLFVGSDSSYNIITCYCLSYSRDRYNQTEHYRNDFFFGFYRCVNSSESLIN